MKKLMVMALLVFSAIIAHAGVNIPYTEIPYEVNYHWGIIDVNIAHGTVKIESDGNSFHGTLDGTSIPWEGRVILVSDTLDFDLIPAEGLSKEKVNNQQGWYRRPKVNYFRSQDYNPGNPDYFRNIAGEGNYDASDDTMEAITVTSDMIGMYYYAQEIDFSSMKPGDQVTIPIDGEYAHEVVVTYLGEGSYSNDDSTFQTHDLEFEYSYDHKLSGYEVRMKVGQENKLPVFISASLPVGKVEMLYSGE